MSAQSVVGHEFPTHPTRHPVVSQLCAINQFRAFVDVAMVVVILVLANLIAHFTTAWAAVATIPITAIALIALVRYNGLSWTELGFGRAHWKAGVGYALACVLAVTTVIAVAVTMPMTRPLFLNNHYATMSGALVASMVVIPLQTVIPEELAFRGALHGALHRAWGFRGVAAAGSLLFGLWHVATSLGLTDSNVGFTRVFGGGFVGMLAGVTLAVVATGAAGFIFSWLRRRSGSIIAPIALHWSLNGVGALAAAIAWHVST